MKSIDRWIIRIERHGFDAVTICIFFALYLSGFRSFSIKGFRVFSVFSCFIIFLNSKILFLIRDNPWTVRESAFVTHVFASILYIDALNICYRKLSKEDFFLHRSYSKKNICICGSHKSDYLWCDKKRTLQ